MPGLFSRQPAVSTRKALRTSSTRPRRVLHKLYPLLCLCLGIATCLSLFERAVATKWVRNGRSSVVSTSTQLPLDHDRACKVDLVLVIDTSQSVEGDFEEQMRFAIDLIKRLPDEDFSERVQVTAITFNNDAKLQFSFGALRQKAAVLDALSAIKHTGGSTSIATGVHLGINQIERARRRDATLMAVLISDGQSQDQWERVLSAAGRLKSTGATVYAVTLRIKQFLNEAETALLSCKNPLSTTPSVSDLHAAATSSTKSPPGTRCPNEQNDLLIVIDTSTSVEAVFYAQRKFAAELAGAIPEEDFKSGRVAVAIVKFNSQAEVELDLRSDRSKSTVLHRLEMIQHTGGQTSLVTGTRSALSEISRGHRKAALLWVVIISDGNSQDAWSDVQAAAKDLRDVVTQSQGQVFAVTVSATYYYDELKEYASDAANVYTDERLRNFIRDVNTSITACHLPTPTKGPLVGISRDSPKSERPIKQHQPNVEFLHDKNPTRVQSNNARKTECRKLDLILILDSSTPRYLHRQKKLALRLINRLPIGSDGTHVAVGVNSFTGLPTLRQTLGLGQERGMVRKAIEDMRYIGGSTLNAEAVELAVDDLAKGRRASAIQVVVLMSAGMSQDPWARVLESSKRLEATGAERFGVAFDEGVDLKELVQYTGNNPQRIYRDNETNRFLSDVTALLGPKDECQRAERVDDFQLDEPACELDLIVLFDSTDNTPNMTDPRINLNRYLLLDLLGSLLEAVKLRVAVISFSTSLKVEHGFADLQDRDALFKHIKAIEPRPGQARYSTAVKAGIEYYDRNKRPGVKNLMIIVGNGNSTDSDDEAKAVGKQVQSENDLEIHAVDSGKSVDSRALAAYTGSRHRVYNYDRNSEFATLLVHSVMSKGACTTHKEALGPEASSLRKEHEGTAKGGFRSASGWQNSSVPFRQARSNQRFFE